MCGIAGIAGFKDEKLLKRMTDLLSHRGPDGEGFYIGDQKWPVYLGHRRLAIIDIASGDQPIFNEDKSIVIVFNGEIYNYQDIRKELKAKHQFKTNSDTEVIVHAYEEYGPKCLDKFNGMFAFALFDQKKNRLFLARDRLGIKPLYYFYDASQDKLVFASEIKAILADPKIQALPNDKIIFEYLAYRLHDDKEETFFQGIKRLLPGHYLIIKPGHFKTRKYWYPKFSSKISDGRGTFWIKRFKNLLSESVRLMLHSDVPIGTCFSGGIDSSSIVCLIRKELVRISREDQKNISERQKTFSAIYPNEPNNEKEFIDEVLKKIPAEAYFNCPDKNKFWEEVEHLIWHLDEPVISSGPYAVWCTMRDARKHGVKVVLDGQGPDELLGGYIPYHLAYFLDLKKRKQYFRLFKEIIFSLDIIWPFIKNWLKCKLLPNYSVDNDKLINRHFIKEFKNKSDCDWRKQGASLGERFFRDVLYYSIQPILRYEDRCSMAHGVEARVPYLDHRLVELVFNMPEDMKIRNGWNKYVLRQAMKGILPEKNRLRRWKVGFTTPEGYWFRTQEKILAKIIESDSFKSRKYFQAQHARDYLRRYCSGESEMNLILWRMINLELWLRIFIDKDKKTLAKIKALSEKSSK